MTSDADFDKVFSHHTAQVNGITVHYVIGGRGDPVVLLHGWPQTWYEWRQVMPALAQRYTVIAPDMRGLVYSGKPTTGYDKRTVATDIYHLVCQLGFQRIFLVGHDMGGMVAYAYAAAYREHVRRLAILEILLPGFGFEEQLHVTRERRIWHPAFHMAPDIPEALITGRERIYLSWFYKLAFSVYNPAAITEADINEYVRCYSAPGALRAGFEYYRSVFDDAEHNQESAKTKLKIPVLALGGERSLRDQPMRSMQAVAEDVRGGVVEHAGHWIPEERPDFLTEQLLTFFEDEK